MAAFRNLTIGTLKLLGPAKIAKTTRVIREDPTRALPILGINHHHTLQELEEALQRRGS
jgi:hypothetical protein